MLRIESTVDQDQWRDEAENQTLVETETLGPVVVAHVVDNYNCYPGERVTFYTRLELREAAEDLRLSISLPAGVRLGDYQAPPELTEVVPALELDSAGHSYLTWLLDGKLAAGTRYEYRAEAIVLPTPENVNLVSRAVVIDQADGPVAEETVTIAVRAKGKYLKYLPALYERDELMGRFLILFESFWAPFDQQIEAMHYYFDPRMTPLDFLPWLASWLDMALDERWPQTSQRQLLRWAIALHRSRGTKWGLLKYLEMYTGQKAEVVERRAKNFVLGPGARMGPGIALGQGNRPHTFTVTLRLPPIEVKSKKERKRLEQIRRRAIESIIEMQKPAHTVYNLDLETLSPEEANASKEPEALPDKTKEDEIADYAAIWFKLD